MMISSNSKIQAPPSAVFSYSSPSSADKLKPPPSPTSSIKGCFVRSRPTSTQFSDYDCSEFANFSMDTTLAPGEEGHITTTGTATTILATSATLATDDLLERASLATAKWAQNQRVNKDSDTRSLAPSTLTTVTERRPFVPVKITRRSEMETDAEVAMMGKGKENKGVKGIVDAADGNNKSRRRTWPSYKAIRKTVSSILHRKDGPVFVSVVGADKGEVLDAGTGAGPSIGRVKSSSASLFSRRRRATVSSVGDKTGEEAASREVVPRGRAATLAILEHRAQLRRSRSFSGFTNVLSIIDDAGDDDDGDLDEATTEARGVVLNIRKRWNFEEISEREESDNAFMFERCIE